MTDLKKPMKPKMSARRKFSLEDKKNLYEKWRSSGLSKNKFCKHHKLNPSPFSKWCKLFTFNPINSPKQNWVPVISKPEPSSKEHPDQVSAEITLPNKIVVRLSLALANLNDLLKELGDATTTLR